MKLISRQEEKDLQQPIAKDGYTNDWFDELYPNVNPHKNTERDRRFKGQSYKFDSRTGELKAKWRK